MDDRRFDAVTRSLASRRAAVGGVLAALLGVAIPGTAAARKKPKKCKPKCPVCKKCVKGKCKPQPDGTACGAGQTCTGGDCLASSCPDGQVRCDGACVDTATNDANCGACGKACPAGSGCCGGGCCEGCCDGTVCKGGLSDNACGASGTACAACAAGQDCNGGTCTCDGVSCDGCCDGTTCRPGTTDANCGINGGVCDACAGTGESCGGGGQAGVCGCTSESDAVTCAGKCGTVQNNCGQPVDCPPPSDAATCAGKCGTVQNSCGQAVNCTALCVGCCDGGTCRPGFATQACGKNGAACTACTDCTSCDNGTCAPGCGSCATCNGNNVCESFADGTNCGTSGGCDDGRCLRRYNFCANSGGCSANYAVAVNGGGLNLCMASGRPTAGRCTTTSDCANGWFCAAYGADPICAQGCQG